MTDNLPKFFLCESSRATLRRFIWVTKNPRMILEIISPSDLKVHLLIQKDAEQKEIDHTIQRAKQWLKGIEIERNKK